MAYADVILADSPSGYWRLADTGSTVADATGHGNSGTFSAGGITKSQAGALAGDANTAMLFARSGSGLITLTPASPTTLSAPFSVEVWANIATTSTAVTFFGSRNATNAGAIDCTLNSSGFHADIGTAAAWLSTAANANYTQVLNVWQHIVIAITTTDYTVYRNGAQIGTGSLAGTALCWDNVGHTPVIGDYEVGAAAPQFFDGYLDELAVYPTALSAAKVLSHYQAGIYPFSTITTAASSN